MATFLKNVNMVSRSSTQYLDEKLSDSDLRGYHGKYILTVCARPGLSQEEIAREIFINKSNVARQLKVLEKLGYVERRASPEDKRKTLIYPTEKALDMRERIRSLNAAWREEITRGFTEEEKEELVRLTAKLYKNAVEYMEGTGD